MTDLQLEIMRLWADKTLGFGCMVGISDTYYDAQKNKETNIWNRVKTLSNDIIEWDYIVIWWTIKNKILQIIWHPITRWRLCYLNNKINIANINIDLAIDISNKFNNFSKLFFWLYWLFFFRFAFCYLSWCKIKSIS